MNRAVVYARVSKQTQTEENQLPVLEAWAKQRGFDLVATYQERATSWTAGHQKEWQRLTEDARKRKFDVVLVWALDRVTREGPSEILKRVNTLKTYGCRIISYQESWTEAPGELGELLYSLVAWVAQMESKRRSERTKAGLKRTLQAGRTKAGKRIKKLGRPAGSLDKKKRKKRSALVYA